MIKQNLIGDISSLNLNFEKRYLMRNKWILGIPSADFGATFYKFLIYRIKKSVKIEIYYGRNDHKEDKIKR